MSQEEYEKEFNAKEAAKLSKLTENADILAIDTSKLKDAPVANTKLKVLNLSTQDMAGAGYCLSHALNKLGDVQSINLRTSNNYINYPSMTEARFYGKDGCKKIVEDADVVIFHSAVRPFFDAFQLDKEKLKAKRKFVYFHGSDCRNYGEQTIKDAKEVMGDFEILVSTPDLLASVPKENSHWMPVARDFQAIKTKYGDNPLDMAALNGWAELKRRTVLGHAPTNLQLKGSAIFYKIITEVLETLDDVEFQSIKDLPWDSCLRLLRTVNVLYDQHVIGSYGMVAVEASIFGAAVFCKLKPDVATFIEREAGIKQPFIQWLDEDELRTQSYMIAQDPKLQQEFGVKTEEFCHRLHDDINVASRFMRILERT
ncbi:MAG: hypothetical protein PHU43_03440 [Candidatus Bipolaricaulis sp.]|nr:hypothetical protein [Candidatus Bipolaricaulis sp.]